MGYCYTLKSELNPCQTYYDETRIDDVETSFGPSSIWARLAKIALAGFVIYTWFSTFLAVDSKKAYFYFLTYWSLILQLVYHLFSVFNSLFPPVQGLTLRIKITWYFFNLAAHTECLVALLYWTLDYEAGRSITFNMVAPHAITAVLILIDGFFINRIPIRFYHWLGTIVPIEVFFLGWTILHVVLDLNNPNKSDEDPETNDDLLYTVVDWDEELLSTAIIFVIVILVVGPIIQLILFTMSLYLPCCGNSSRNDDESSDDNKQDDTDPNREEMYAGVY